LEKQNNRKNEMFFSIVIFLCVLSISSFCHAQEIIKSIDIGEAYALAIKTHERIMIAESEVAKSKLLPKKATTIMMPRLSMSGGYTRLNEPIEFEAQIGNITLPPIETVPDEQWLGNFKYTQPIYEGRFFPLRRMADQTIEITSENYYQTIQSLLLQVAQVYYEVLKSEELVQNAKETVNLTREELRVSKVRFKAGNVTEDAVLRSELNSTRAKSNVIRNVNHLKLAQEFFKNLVGMETRNLNLIKPPELKEMVEDYEALIYNAFDSRHDYRASFLKIDVAKNDIELVKARFHPRIEGSWDYFWVDNPAWLQNDEYWVASLKVNIPLFEGGLRFLDLKEKQENLHQAELTLKALEDTIRLEVEDAMLKVQTDRSILANLTKQVELAKKNYEIIFTKFKFGAATSLDLNEALTSLDLARTQLISKTYDYQVALLNQEKALGVFAQDFTTKIDQKRQLQ